MRRHSRNIITKYIPNILILLLLLGSSGLRAQTADSLIIENNNQNEKSDSTQQAVKSPQKAMIYALIFPGMGQLYNGKKLKALILGGAEIGLLTNSIYLNQKYKQSTYEFDKEFYIQNRNLSTWYLVGVVLFNVLDAFVDAHLSDFDESPDLSLQMIPSDYDARVMMTLAVKF